MSILIIGGSGFIGKSLCQSLLADGETVIIKTRNAKRTEAKFDTSNSRLKIIECFSQLNENPSTIISLAGAGIVDKRWTENRKKELINSRLQPLLELREWLEQNNIFINTLLVGSAIGFYGYGSNPEQEFIENSEYTDDFTHQICRKLEDTGNSLGKFFNNICSLRTGVVLGNGGALTKMSLPAKFHLNGKIGDGKQWVSWIHIEDWIAATKHILSLESPKKSYNLTSPNPVTNKELSDAIGKALNKSFQLPVPSLSLKLLIGEASVLLLGSQKVLPANLNEDGFEFRFAGIDKACEDLLTS